MNSVLTMAVNDSPITAVKQNNLLLHYIVVHVQEITQSTEKKQLNLLMESLNKALD